MSAAAAYTLVGDLIPVPVDELLVYCITGGIAAVPMLARDKSDPE